MSPNFPNNYPINLQKTDVIQVEQGLILSLQFTAFDIQYIHPFDHYCTDHLTIMDGDGTTLMKKSCSTSSDGSSLPANITSTSNVVKLLFITDDSDSGNSGWSVSWSAVTPGKCQQHVWIVLDHSSNFSFLTIMVANAPSISDLHTGLVALACFLFHLAFQSSFFQLNTSSHNRAPTSNGFSISSRKGKGSNSKVV